MANGTVRWKSHRGKMPFERSLRIRVAGRCYFVDLLRGVETGVYLMRFARETAMMVDMLAVVAKETNNGKIPLFAG